MKRLLVMALVIVVGMMFTFADDTPVAEKKPKVEKERITGEVKSIDMENGSFVIIRKKDKEELTFTADEEKLKKIKVGNRVMVVVKKGETKVLKIRLVKVPGFVKKK